MKWKETSRIYRRVMGLALGRKKGNAKLGELTAGANMNDEEMIASRENGTVLPDLGTAKMLHTRIRYFTDGAVIGSKSFVNEAFLSARERFSEKRKDGARRMRGSGAPASGGVVVCAGSTGESLGLSRLILMTLSLNRHSPCLLVEHFAQIQSNKSG